MSRSLQEYTNKAKQEIVVHHNKNRRILAMKELELIRADLNRQHELSMKELEVQHRRNIMALQSEAQGDKQRHEHRMVELKYLKEDVQDSLGAKKRELIIKLQALLRTEAGIQKLESLMNIDAFTQGLNELLPDIYSQLCEIFQIDRSERRA